MGTLSALLPAVLLWGSLSEARTVNLFDGSREVFESHWMEKRLRRPLTSYDVVEDGSETVLMARSEKSASAIWRQLKLDPFQTASITWRWKVAKSLTGDQDERQKAGDDYAARVYVFFGRTPFSRKTRGICYVWAGTQPVGSAYPSPYSDRIVTIVLRSGDAPAASRTGRCTGDGIGVFSRLDDKSSAVFSGRGAAGKAREAGHGRTPGSQNGA